MFLRFCQWPKETLFHDSMCTAEQRWLRKYLDANHVNELDVFPLSTMRRMINGSSSTPMPIRFSKQNDRLFSFHYKKTFLNDLEPFFFAFCSIGNWRRTIHWRIHSPQQLINLAASAFVWLSTCSPSAFFPSSCHSFSFINDFDSHRPHRFVFFVFLSLSIEDNFDSRTAKTGHAPRRFILVRRIRFCVIVGFEKNKMVFWEKCSKDRDKPPARRRHWEQNDNQKGKPQSLDLCWSCPWRFFRSSITAIRCSILFDKLHKCSTNKRSDHEERFQVGGWFSSRSMVVRSRKALGFVDIIKPLRTTLITPIVIARINERQFNLCNLSCWREFRISPLANRKRSTPKAKFKMMERQTSSRETIQMVSCCFCRIKVRNCIALLATRATKIEFILNPYENSFIHTYRSEQIR